MPDVESRTKLMCIGTAVDLGRITNLGKVSLRSQIALLALKLNASDNRQDMVCVKHLEE